MPKPYIDTFRGKAYFVKTITEDKYGNWDDHWETIRGEFVIHEGNKHHVYKIGYDKGYEEMKLPKFSKKNIALAKKVFNSEPLTQKEKEDWSKFYYEQKLALINKVRYG